VGGIPVRPGPGGTLRHGPHSTRRLIVPGSHGLDGRRYRGRLVIQPSQAGLSVVNEVPVERYVEGILLREVYPGWGAAVLRAQAVVARTYALYRRRRTPPERAWDLTAAQDSQVYGGIAAEAPEARRAVAATHGEVLVFRGRPILAAYHSASGGRTASAREVWGREVPYLVSVPVDGEEVSPDTYWRIPVSTATLGQALAGLGWPIGRVEEVRIAERSKSGRVRRAEVRGSGGEVELSGRDLRRAAGGLPSTLFEVRREGDRYLFVGSGHGHGVGMSQWGARAMAQRGASYREILEKFYPGARLRGGWGAGKGL
jgi:stage II sporulation protein D